MDDGPSPPEVHRPGLHPEEQGGREGRGPSSGLECSPPCECMNIHRLEELLSVRRPPGLSGEEFTPPLESYGVG